MRAGIWRAWKTSRSEDRSAHHTPQCRRLARTRHTTDQSSPPNPATPQHHALRRRFTASDTTLWCHACAITWTRERQIGLGALKQRPARDPATAPLPTHTSRFPPTHPETSHNYARRPKAAASAADASRSRHRAAETSLQRQLPRAHYASLWAASSARAGQLSPNAAQQAGGRVAATIPPPPPAQGAAAPSSLSPQYWAISRKVPK